MPPKRPAPTATLKPAGSFFSGFLFLASAIGGLYLEYQSTLGYDGSQPYDWLLESMSDLGVAYRQVHPLKHYNVISWRAQTMNFGLLWTGASFALAQLYLLVRTRGQFRAGTTTGAVATLRSSRALLAALFAVGAALMALISGGPREKHWGTIGWHWNGFALMAIAGNLNSILAALQPYQVGGLDGSLGYRAVSLLLGLAGLASWVKFNFLLGDWNYLTQLGIWQRGSLYSVAAWQAITGLGLIGGWVLSVGAKSKQA